MIKENDLNIKTLIEYGLSEKEAKVYLTALKLEVATANEIAKTAGINRSSTYVVLESLKKKGLIGISDDKEVRQYISTSPEILLQTAEDSANKHRGIKERIADMLPSLKALHKETRGRPKVRVFEGLNGVRETYWDLFAVKVKDIKTYANPANIFKYLPDFEQHDQERSKRKIKMYAIIPSSKDTIDILKKHRAYSPYEFSLVSEEDFNFSSDMGIYGDRVSFVSPKDQLGIIIESADIAEMLRNSFDLVWKWSKALANKNQVSKILKTE